MNTIPRLIEYFEDVMEDRQKFSSGEPFTEGYCKALSDVIRELRVTFVPAADPLPEKIDNMERPAANSEFREICMQTKDPTAKRLMVSRMVNEIVMRNARWEEYENHIRQEMVYLLARQIFFEDVGTPVIISHPADWREAFKERWFPKWLKRKFPVKETTHTVNWEAWYPDMPVEPDGALIKRFYNKKQTMACC